MPQHNCWIFWILRQSWRSTWPAPPASQPLARAFLSLQCSSAQQPRRTHRSVTRVQPEREGRPGTSWCHGMNVSLLRNGKNLPIYVYTFTYKGCVFTHTHPSLSCKPLLDYPLYFIFYQEMGMTWELILILYQKWNMQVENSQLALLINKKLSKSLKRKDNDLQDMCSFILHFIWQEWYSIQALQHALFILTTFQFSHTQLHLSCLKILWFLKPDFKSPCWEYFGWELC